MFCFDVKLVYCGNFSKFVACWVTPEESKLNHYLYQQKTVIQETMSKKAKFQTEQQTSCPKYFLVREIFL